MAGARPHGPAGAPRRAGPLGIAAAAAAAAQRAPPPAPAGLGPPAIAAALGPAGAAFPRSAEHRAPSARPAAGPPAGSGSGGSEAAGPGPPCESGPRPGPAARTRMHGSTRRFPAPQVYLGAADTPCPAHSMVIPRHSPASTKETPVASSGISP